MSSRQGLCKGCTSNSPPSKSNRSGGGGGNQTDGLDVGRSRSHHSSYPSRVGASAKYPFGGTVGTSATTERGLSRARGRRHVRNEDWHTALPGEQSSVSALHVLQWPASPIASIRVAPSHRRRVSSLNASREPGHGSMGPTARAQRGLRVAPSATAALNWGTP